MGSFIRARRTRRVCVRHAQLAEAEIDLKIGYNLEEYRFLEKGSRGRLAISGAAGLLPGVIRTLLRSHVALAQLLLGA